MPTLSPETWTAIRLTLELASTTTIILLVIGTPIAWRLARSRSWWKEPVAAIVSLPLVLPPTVLGFYLLVALGRTDPAEPWRGFGASARSPSLSEAWSSARSSIQCLCHTPHSQRL